MKNIISIILLLFACQLQAQKTYTEEEYISLEKQKIEVDKQLIAAEKELLELNKKLPKLIATNNKLTNQINAINTSKSNKEKASKALQESLKKKNEEIAKLKNELKNKDNIIAKSKSSNKNRELKEIIAEFESYKITSKNKFEEKEKTIKGLEADIYAVKGLKNLVESLGEFTEGEGENLNDKIISFFEKEDITQQQPIDTSIVKVMKHKADIKIFIDGLDKKQYSSLVQDLTETNIKLINYEKALDLIQNYKAQLAQPYNAKKNDDLLKTEKTILEQIPSEVPKYTIDKIKNTLKINRDLLNNYCTKHDAVAKAVTEIIIAASPRKKEMLLSTIKSATIAYPYLTTFLNTNKNNLLNNWLFETDNPLKQICN